jgi:hypothetical protein
MLWDCNNHLAWHYTTGHSFVKIAESGVLRPATTYTEEWEKPVLWLSYNQNWEPTASILMKKADTGELKLGTFDETHFYGGGLVRFGILLNNTGPYLENSKGRVGYLWPDIADEAGIAARMKKALEKTARDVGSNPKDWVGYLETIPIDEFEVFETFDYMSHEWINPEEKFN